MRSADLNIISEARQRAADGRARAIRRRAALSQQQVADTVGVSRAAVAAWETGRRLPAGRHALRYGRLLRQLANWAA